MKCYLCKQDAVVRIEYMQRELCQQHFFRMFEKRVMHTIRKFGMVKKGMRIGIAVSGGKDSTVMLHLLAQVCKPMRCKLVAILADEGIRGYRDRAIVKCKKECKKVGVPLKIYSFKKEYKVTVGEIGCRVNNSCSYCGVLRRHILNKAARELKLDVLAFGHNLDDAAQTVIMNITRNEPFRLARFGASGGISEDESFVPRIRPLIETPEKEIALYSILKGYESVMQDCPFASQAFRDRAREFLNGIEEEYPGSKKRVLESFWVIKRALEKEYAAKKGEKIGKCAKCGEPTSQKKECKACELAARARGIIKQRRKVKP
ncbi:tRNA 2-thiocytidine biosynthesis protein TtcA [Candidatus Gugararchaeum adminiculabundum]|nr:tRNA 2-thiocytidine biosynthesis protein TtcA [Candidatus Gugararchaeum adminiculabundum]